MGLTQSNYISKAKAFKDLLEFLENVGIETKRREEIEKDYRDAVKDNQASNVFSKHAITGSFLLQTINKLFRCTRDP